MQASIPWHRLLTQRLDETTKLVGSVISCEGAPFKGDQASKWRFNPHVQTYAIALDRVQVPQALSHLHASIWLYFNLLLSLSAVSCSL